MLSDRSHSDIVAWAIDPFEGKVKPHPSEVRNLMSWIENNGYRIQPIYIYNRISERDTTFDAVKIETSIIKYFQEIGCSRVLVPKVLVTDNVPTAGRIEKLIQYCDEVDAEMIVVSSRGRKGFDRFVFGSFAEGLLLHSKRPIYFLTHQNGTPTGHRDNKILFATDFSEHSKAVFVALLEQVKSSHAEIILFHAVAQPTSVTTEGVIVVPDDYCDRQQADAEEAARGWAKKAQSVGIKVRAVILNVGVAANVPSSIIDAAKKESVRFIAVASNSGKVGSLFFGSTARDVFRTNLFPVWVCGPQAAMASHMVNAFAGTTA